MNKQELIDSIAIKTDESKTVVAQIVDTMVDTITETLVDGDPVVLLGFGRFDTSLRKERVGRNPQTGDEMRIPEAWVPRFKAGKKLKESINNKECVES